jgi:hypothetical protein
VHGCGQLERRSARFVYRREVVSRTSSYAEFAARLAQSPLNRDRALAFAVDRPVLRVAQDSLVIGFSVTEVNGRSTVVETNQLRESSISRVPEPITCRSAAVWDDAEVELEHLALDHLMAADLDGTVDDRRRRASAAISGASRRTETVAVDDETAAAETLTVGGQVFLRLDLRGPTLITASLPAALLEGGLVSVT